jgi:hypothetical protein
MTNAPRYRVFLPVIVLFLVTLVPCLLLADRMNGWGIDSTVVIAGSFILLLASSISLLLYQRAMQHANTMGFLRNTYSGLFFKLLFCAIAAIVYVLVAKDKLNKPALFTCMFLYLMYTFLEMRSLMQWNKARRNA